MSLFYIIGQNQGIILPTTAILSDFKRMLRGYKYRLYPTKSQQELIDKHIEACRCVYNLALETKIYAYKSHQKNLSRFDLINQLPDLKSEFEWLKEVYNHSLQQKIFDLDKAFINFYKGDADFPKFKKKTQFQKFRNPDGKEVEIKDNKICFPKFRDGIKFIEDRKHEGEIRSSTISRTPTGKYFISILCDTKSLIPQKEKIVSKTAIGIDLGLKHFLITSDGIKVDNPRYLRESLKRLKVLQRRNRNKKRGSKNSKKAFKKLSIIHEKVANQRYDFLQKLSTELVNNHDTICLEDLNIQGMSARCKPKKDEQGNFIPNGQSAKSGLNKSISDAGWALFVKMINYKSEWRGKNVLQMPRWQASTKVCSNCQHKQNLTLAQREWVCEACGTLHDRDENAAKNIKTFCIKNSGKVIPAVSVEMLAQAKSVKQKVKKSGKLNCPKI